MEERIRRTLTEVFDPQIAQAAELENLGGHASLRIYWRIHLPQDLDPPRVFPRGESTLMAMVLPEGGDWLQSAEGQSSTATAPKELPFVDVQRYLANIGMPVPSIDRIDMETGVLLLEDLGDRLFEDAVLDTQAGPDPSGARLSTYREAIDLLVSFQAAVENDRTRQQGPRQTIAYSRSFDAELLRWELDHYLEWGLQAQQGREPIAFAEKALAGFFDQIVSALTEAPQTLVLRDYQSRNIMFKKDRWILIDFQDAMIGPVVYDLVALLRDSYIELPPEEVQILLDYYIHRGAASGLPWCDQADPIRRLFHLQTVQRKLKDAGRCIFIDRVKNNPSFLGYYGPSIQYVKDALAHLPELQGLQLLLQELEPGF